MHVDFLTGELVHPHHVGHDSNQYEKEEVKEDDLDDFDSPKQETFDFLGIFSEILQERIDSLSTGM